MYIMQLVHLKNIDNQKVSQNKEEKEGDDLIPNKSKKINDSDLLNKNISNQVKSQLKNTEQIKENINKSPELIVERKKNKTINSFQDLINLADKEKEVELKYDLERNVKLVSFNRGKINISFNERLNKNFIKILTEKLLSWTNERWIISLSKDDGAKTIYERNLEVKSENILKVKNSDEAKKILSAFPDAKIVEVTEEEDA